MKRWKITAEIESTFINPCSANLDTGHAVDCLAINSGTIIMRIELVELNLSHNICAMDINDITIFCKQNL